MSPKTHFLCQHPTLSQHIITNIFFFHHSSIHSFFRHSGNYATRNERKNVNSIIRYHVRNTKIIIGYLYIRYILCIIMDKVGISFIQAALYSLFLLILWQFIINQQDVLLYFIILFLNCNIRAILFLNEPELKAL